MLHRIAIPAIFLLFAMTGGGYCYDTAGYAAPKYPFQDPTLPWDVRVDDLIGRLTLEELVNQSMALYRHTNVGIPRLGIPAYRFIEECLRGYGRHNATAFPQSLGLAATFSREILFNMSTVVSMEVRAFYNADRKNGVFGHNGLSCFSPVINIMRHPLWGRNQETYGEDPYLSGELVAEYVRGLQGSDARYIRANAGCKHFATYAGPENYPSSRFDFNAVVSESDLRMTFLPQFKACVKAGTYNLMCSYSSLNGVPACVNKKLLTDILRKEWGFTGYVISDSGALDDVVSRHKYVKTHEEAAADAIKAGCNMDLGSEGHNNIFQAIPKAIKLGLLSKQEFLTSMKPVFYTRMRLGDFDPVEMNPYSSIDLSVVLSPAHREAAVRAGTMSLVLLKNLNGLLPIKKHFKNLAIIGPMVDNAASVMGTYTASPDARFIETPLVGLRGLGDNVTSVAGCVNAQCLEYDWEAVKHAVTATDFVVICLGTGPSVEAEARDRVELDLPGKQLQLLKDAIFFSNGAPLVLLLFTAGPLDVTFAQGSPSVQAIVQCFYPAEATGEALMRVLTATGPHSVPAARLPNTWPAQLHQIAPITDYNMSDHQTYRYLYEEPLYPFGYGLSYSRFSYDKLSVSPSSLRAGNNVSVTVEVTNLGPYDAEEVVQLYLAWNESHVPVPRWTLVGFDRPFLKVNEPLTVTFSVTGEQMAVWLDDESGFVVQTGAMFLYAGGQQPNQRVDVGSNVLRAQFNITA